MDRDGNVRRLLLSKTSMAVICVLLAGVAFAGWYFLFRTISGKDSMGTEFVIKRRWGRPTLISIDRNGDGRIDYRGVPISEGINEALAVSPREFWADDNFDGNFETHIVLGLESERPTEVYEFDQNGDGTYDIHLTGEEADQAYLKWLRSFALGPIEGPRKWPDRTAREND